MIKVILCDRNFKFFNICFNLVTAVNSAKKSTYAKVCEKKNYSYVSNYGKEVFNTFAFLWKAEAVHV